ncbi:MAG: hypothetical protein JWL65_4007 [Gammaproteobacteria bacterium]|nr:hypothetical protein [Gammaproteobacteria bacterium]
MQPWAGSHPRTTVFLFHQLQALQALRNPQNFVLRPTTKHLRLQFAAVFEQILGSFLNVDIPIFRDTGGLPLPLSGDPSRPPQRSRVLPSTGGQSICRLSLSSSTIKWCPITLGGTG